MTAPITLAARLLGVAKDCAYIEKDAKNTQQGYGYLSSAAVLARFGPSCEKHGVSTRTHYETITPWDATVTTGKGSVMRFARVKCVITLTDVITNESVTTEGLGDGSDVLDKAIYKAQTGARRDAIKALCNTSTKEDAEEPGDPEHEPRPHPQPAPSPSMPAAVTAAAREPSSMAVLTWGAAKGKAITDVATPLLRDYLERCARGLADPKCTPGNRKAAEWTKACVEVALRERELAAKVA